MNTSNLLYKYRLFRANNRFNYPFVFLFFLMGVIKNIFQLSVLAAAVWFVFSFTSQPLQTSDEYVISGVSEEFPIGVNAPVQTIEVLAVASGSSKVAVAMVEPVAIDDNTSIKTASNIHNWEWLLKQDKKKFTVQFGSSPDKALLLESAKAFPTTEIVAVYPFKKTPSGRPVFGFSSGIYDSLESAEAAISDLPKSVRSFGAWIRPIGVVQKHITSMVKS